MKKMILCTLIYATLLNSCSSEDENDPSTQIINFGDSGFKKMLLDNTLINSNDDNNITLLEAANFTGTIAGHNSDIQDVSGIEHFVNVTKISLFNCNISEIDVSKNTKVTQLLLESNNLKTIDVSKLVLLTDFKCHSNDLIEANVANGNNANMTRMELQKNENLSCILVDEVSTSRRGWLKDETAKYKITCD